MHFLTYKENDLMFVYNSTIRIIILRQHLTINSSYLIKLPIIKYFFIYRKIFDVNLLKSYNNLTFLWLLTGKKFRIKKFAYKLERGVKFYRFLMMYDLVKDDLILKNFDFFINKFFFLIDNLYLRKLNENNYYVLKFNNLEYFSNIRLAPNFYTSRLNDILNICFYLKKMEINLFYFLKQFKFFIKN